MANDILTKIENMLQSEIRNRLGYPLLLIIMVFIGITLWLTSLVLKKLITDWGAEKVKEKIKPLVLVVEKKKNSEKKEPLIRKIEQSEINIKKTDSRLKEMESEYEVLRRLVGIDGVQMIFGRKDESDSVTFYVEKLTRTFEESLAHETLNIPGSKLIVRANFYEKGITHLIDTVSLIHSRGVRHRNLNPKTVMCRIDPDHISVFNDFVITDFKMARDTFDIQTASISTRVDDARLRYYVSPELRRLIFNDKLQTGEKGLNRWIQDSPDDAKKNPKVDVYSLTIIIVELLFGTTLCSKIQSIDNSLTTAGDYQGNEIKFYRDICAAIDRKGVAEMFDEMVTEQEEINRNQKRTLIDLIKSGVQIDPRERCSMEDLSNKWKGFRKTIMRE